MRVFYDEQIFSEQVYGGISRYFSALALELDQLPGVIARLSSPFCTNQYARELPGNIRSGIALPGSLQPGRLFRNVNRLLSIPVARRFRPDILHETYYWNARRPVQPGRGVVTTVHDMIHERFPEEFLAGDPTAKRKRQAVREADLVICVSENTRRDLIDAHGIDPGKTRVIHHGVDHLAASVREPVRYSGRPYLLYVGQRAGYKNFRSLLHAWAGDRGLAAEYDLVCFGGEPWSEAEGEEIRRLSAPRERLSRVSGGDDFLVGLYRGASVFVYPSLYEGFGIPPLEAMSQGCPVVSSNVSSMPEVLGTAADFFEPDDPDALRDALYRVLGDAGRQAELRSLGREQSARYTWRRCAEETLTAYRSLD